MSTPLVIPGLVVHRRIHSHVLMSPLAVPRQGVMLHYDDSSRDDWAVAWFSDPQCTNGYTWLVLDDGDVVELADPGKRTPHAGPCLTANANSVFYGLAAATNGQTPAAPTQLEAMIGVTVALFRFHRWGAKEAEARIHGHDEQAIWTVAYTKNAKLWGKTGRKVDPTGERKDGRKIIDLAAFRAEVAFRLGGPVPRGAVAMAAMAPIEVPRAA